MKLSKCSSSLVAKVKIEDDNGGSYHATMFTIIILAIVGDGVDHSSTTAISTQLLHSEKMTFKINNKDVVTEANSLKACENVDPGATAVKESATWREDPEIAGGGSSSAADSDFQ